MTFTRASRRPGLRAFGDAREGASALEFAIVATPFLFLLLAMLELSLIFVANTNLQNATFLAAREIRVGQIMAAGKGAASSNGNQLDLTDFKARVCKNMQLVSASDCAANLYVDVRELPNFSGVMAPSPFTGKTLDTSNFCFYSAAGGGVVEMRAYYLWPIFTPVMLSVLVNTTDVTGPGGQGGGQWFALSSHEVFRNEPGTGGSNTGAGC